MSEENEKTIGRREFLSSAAVLTATIPLALTLTKSLGASPLKSDRMPGASASAIRNVPVDSGVGTLEEELAKAGFKGATKSRQVKLRVPSIAENGAIVPVQVDAGPAANVKTISIFIDKNPTPLAITIKYSPDNGKAYFNARMRMAKTSNVRALVVMKNGSKLYNSKLVKVTIGGCG
ncbi:MAG TPA: thiosulfate oxidation carrier protein SoxY [Spirochaetes bacterium]|nr:thiosulfate oxidation carrier protein SoxY [Spirochaetota bacterium]